MSSIPSPRGALAVRIELSNRYAFLEQAPNTPLLDHVREFEKWANSTTLTPLDDMWRHFVSHNPPPTTCCLYFLDLGSLVGSDLLYVGRTTRQSAKDRLKSHHIAGKLIPLLGQSPGSDVGVRYGSIADVHFGPVVLEPRTAGEAPLVLPPDPEPLWTWPDAEQEAIVKAVEDALIYKLQPELNKQGKQSYSGPAVHVRFPGPLPWTGKEHLASFELASSSRTG
jgi:hypothetical protein